ncbi:MAG TPA: competence/damage-inducible protein A [Chitinophagales bacterium]
MNATILTIGDELLIGQTIDTNSAYIGRELNKIGIRIYQRIAVGDVAKHITEGLKRASAQSEIVIITGGLGPTKDDITKKTIAEYFGVGFTFYEELWEKMKAIFEKRGAAVLEMNRGQALLPSNAVMLPNARGTAQGMWFDEQGVVYVSMPGVPHEMKFLLDTQVIPKLKTRFELPKILHRTLMTAGAGESSIAAILTDFENALPAYMKLAYLPDLGVLKLRLSAYGEATETEIDTQFELLKKTLGEYVFSDGEISLQEFIGKELLAKGKTIATAESCTGGYISHLITSVAGSSQWFNGGVTAYSYEMKMNILGVKKETLESYGAVSEQTVREMVSGILKMTHADFGIAVSGIAGPSGGTPEKPVGTVWIAVASHDQIIAREFHFFPSRMENIKVSANAALNLLRKVL